MQSGWVLIISTIINNICSKNWKTLALELHIYFLSYQNFAKTFLSFQQKRTFLARRDAI